MAKIKIIDREACRILREAIEENMAEIAAELGVCVKVGSGSFDNGQVTFKVECALIAADGEVQSKEASDFKRLAIFLGLKPGDLGEEFTDYSGKRYRIVGCLPRSTKYPILCQPVSGGRRVKFPQASVKYFLQNHRAGLTGHVVID